jgi:uncharacterized surface protein with fasciclin (FAS1) repeats
VNRVITFALMLFHSLTVAALAAAAVSAQTLQQALSSTPELSNLTALVDPAVFANATDVTLLAPSNEAFASFGRRATVNVSDPEVLAAVLSYHVLKSVVRSSDFQTTPAFVPTLLESPRFTNVTGGQVVKGALNGTDVIVTSGALQTSKVIQADISFDGGVIHVIDTVLTLPRDILTTARAARLTDLLELAAEVGLAAALVETKDITVFAPTNAAFEAAGADLENLDSEGVRNVLGAHVVAGTVGYSSNLKDGDVLTTLSGGIINIAIRDGAVFANDVQVTTPDVLVANGVVHVVDGVLPIVPADGATNGTTTGGAGPTGTGTGTGPTGSPIVPFPGEGAASSLTAGLMQMTALVIGACVFFNA